MILLVDDEALNRKLLQWSLSKLGHEFVHAENGLEAVDRIQEGGIDLVLLDLMMPEMDGFGFLEWRKKASEEIRLIPVIINSALSDMESIKKALNLGAYDYFSKPLSSDTLEVLLPTKVKNAIESSRAVMAVRQRARELREEIAVAERFQVSMLPEKNGLQPLGIDYVYRSCSGVGGDFLDVFPIDDHRFSLFIGDITGHGLKAGMMAMIVRSMYREMILTDPAPSVLIKRLNHSLLKVFEEGHYITGIYGILDAREKTFTFANFAHPRPLLCQEGRGSQQIAGGGHFLGLLDSIEIETRMIPFQTGDRLFLYTDGVTETEDRQGKELLPEGLENIVGDLDNHAPDSWCTTVLDKIVRFHGSPEFDDDILMVTAWWKNGME